MVFLSQWYDFIQTHVGFAALKENFSNYNVPYLYLLTIATYLPIPKLIAIKSLSVVFDIVLGIFTYLILHLKYKRSYAALIGVLVILFAPTIFINSAAWGQCDAIYVSFCLGCLYFLLKERPAWACVFFSAQLCPLLPQPTDCSSVLCCLRRPYNHYHCSNRSFPDTLSQSAQKGLWLDSLKGAS